MADADELPASAHSAWRAYQSMAATKAAHLSLLQHLDAQRERGLSPSIAEQLKLEGLLAEHDAAVKAFAEAMQTLRSADPPAAAALIHAINRDDSA